MYTITTIENNKMHSYTVPHFSHLKTAVVMGSASYKGMTILDGTKLVYYKPVGRGPVVNLYRL